MRIEPAPGSFIWPKDIRIGLLHNPISFIICMAVAVKQYWTMICDSIMRVVSLLMNGNPTRLLLLLRLIIISILISEISTPQEKIGCGIHSTLRPVLSMS